MARAEVDVGGPLVPQCHLINAQQYPLMALVGWQKAVCKSRPGHLQLYQYYVLVILECGYNVKQWNEFQLLCDLERFSKIR